MFIAKAEQKEKISWSAGRGSSFEGPGQTALYRRVLHNVLKVVFGIISLTEQTFACMSFLVPCLSVPAIELKADVGQMSP